MEQYSRMVIELYKEALSQNCQVDPERILEVRKEIACAITAAKVEGLSISPLEELMADVDYLIN